ncbi:Cof-type HAD-IIB family hydrolase [Abyssisolibacter fermentans]|uniref:Cof-type HAD-IIB family hydrolase n=1 Tax=Abyssisolibacter fermentans TaxID=1766203 RepID=UPI00082B445C|nr:Cof-type HAD-IIB family hydrolase [Abyssisolibacter fermentans]
MKHKLLALDMDGTLLNSDLKISQENKMVIEELKEKGVVVTIATGRTYPAIIAYARELNIDVPIIAYNGGIIKYLHNNRIIYSNNIPVEQCINTIDICKEFDVDCYLYSENKIFIEKQGFLLEFYEEINKNLKEKEKIEIVNVKDMKKSLKEDPKIYKIVVFSDNSNAVSEVRKKLLKEGNLEVYKSSDCFLDVTNKGASKGFGVKKLAEYLGIDKEKIIAVGDSDNDISMIKYAGLGIAMGNAIDEAKKVADYVTEANNDNGVANAIRKLVLKEKESYGLI